ncbi:MAG: hypothetical protein LBH29_04685, partial [Elusimicrobiota bacterium]|nr:hypothetical protein [Elusimicrobiota bacterium]
MLKVRVNSAEKSDKYKNFFYNIKIKDGVLFFNLEIKEGKETTQELTGRQKLNNYCFYAVCFNKGKIHIINRNKINSAARFSLVETYTNLIGQDVIALIITGMIAAGQPNNTDIIIDMYLGFKENIRIDAEQKYEVIDFDFSDANPQGSQVFFDSYSLTIDGKEYKADNRGSFIDSEAEQIKLKEQYTITLQKYKRKFEYPLNREIDDDEVTIESTAGITNTRRVYLDKGRG